MRRDLGYYRSLQYRYELEADPEDGGFFASHPELPGCFAQGETADEAVKELDAAREVWLETRFEDGLPIPEPREDEEFSGKLTLRLPPSLHRALTEQAAREQTSLNSFINLILVERQARLDTVSRLEERVESALQRLDSRFANLERRLDAARPVQSTSMRVENRSISQAGTGEGSLLDRLHQRSGRVSRVPDIVEPPLAVAEA